MNFQIEIFAKLSITMIALEFFYSGVSFDMLLEISHLTESWTAVRICTFVRLFTCMHPEVSKELTHALDHFVAFFSILFVVTFEKSILFLKIIFFFYKIENVLRWVGYVVWITKHSWIEFAALEDSYLVVRQNMVLFHEIPSQHFLSCVEGEIIKAI